MSIFSGNAVPALTSMFWKHNNPTSLEIDSLLSKEDVTLQEIMDSEDIISECRAKNKNLIDFLLRPEVMEELVLLTTKEPSIEIEEKSRFKYPNVACELLTCDVPAINERLAGDERLLEKLYEFLENEPPLNPLLASYFSKIMGGLIAKKTEQNWLSYQLTCLQVLDFLKAKDTFLSLLLKHLGTSAIMDLMLKLMTQVEGIEMRQNILNWLDSQRIVQQLVCLLNPTVDRERHDNVAQLLCDFLRTARDTQRNTTERTDPDPLLNTLESPDTIRLILDQIFDKEKCETSIIGSISILLALLDVSQPKSAISMANSIYGNINDEAIDMEQKQKIIRNTTEAIVLRMKDFHNMLLDPPKQPSVVTTICVLDPPLGNTRLQVVRMLAHLIASTHGPLHEQLIELSTFTVLLDLFFKYPWNNFLHTQVENCIVNALESRTEADFDKEKEISPLCRHLIMNCNVIERIVQAWKDNDEQQLEKKAIRQGYMGHLISLVGTILRIVRTTNLGDELKEQKPDTATSLEEFSKRYFDEVMQQEKLLGGFHPSSLIEDNDDFGDIPFPQNSALQQQNFSQYQMQNLPSQFIEGYSGFNDDAFNDGDDTLQTIDNASDINFDLSENELMQRDALFKRMCAENINTFFDTDDQPFEERDHTFQTVIEKKDQADHGEGSSDSDDGSPSGVEDSMEVDPWASPKADPWSALATTTITPPGLTTSSSSWADFSSVVFPEPPAFVATFPEPQQQESSAIQAIGDNKAASGDHPKSEEIIEKVEGSSSEPQPSMSIGGDTCNAAAEKSPDQPTKEPQEKV